jgi:hypothetical protein
MGLIPSIYHFVKSPASLV